MTSLKKFALVASALLAFGSLFSGCTTRSQKETSIPWSRPAGWEGQIPGMGQPAGR